MGDEAILAGRRLLFILDFHFYISFKSHYSHIFLVGGMHTLALTVEGEVYSFGCNDEGALGREIADDEEGFTPGPVKINTAKSPKSTKIVQVRTSNKILCI